MKIQLALDVLDLKKALRIAKEVEEFVDIIEAGTPLIKYEGMRAVRLLRQSFPHKIIMADLKIADVGALETKMAHEAGADMLSCLGTAPFETILETIETAKKYKMKVGIDTIGISDLKKGLLRIEKTKPDFLVIHCGIDEQKRGKDPISSAKLASKITKTPLAIAGGIDPKKAVMLRGIKGIEIVIVGGAITKSKYPKKVAERIKEALE